VEIIPSKAMREIRGREQLKLVGRRVKKIGVACVKSLIKMA
jgi:hypothetical protein